MFKKHIVIALMVLLPCLLSAQSIEGKTYKEWNTMYEFFEGYLNKTTWSDDYTQKTVERIEYRIETIEGITFLITSNTTESRQLLLFNEDIMLLYGTDGQLKYRGISEGIMKMELWFLPDNTTSSSFLTEGQTEYNSKNLECFKLLPWVEGVTGNGIGEWIEFQDANPASRVHVINGFVSFSNPTLFTKNSRIKKVRIHQDGEYKDYDLPDSPHPVPISVTPNSRIRMEIIEVYPGSTWEDTAISGLVFSQY